MTNKLKLRLCWHQSFIVLGFSTITVSLLWIYYVNRMTVQYRVVIEVDTEISTISVSYIYLSMKSLDVKCFMHTGTRSAKAIIVDWSAPWSGPGEDGGPPQVLLHLISSRVLLSWEWHLLAFLWSKAAAILQQNKDEDGSAECYAVIHVMEWGLSIHSTTVAM